jgi:hypothetical protein
MGCESHAPAHFFLRCRKFLLTSANGLCYDISIMSNSTTPKAVRDFFSAMGKKGGAAHSPKGFSVGGHARRAQAASVAARKRNAEARKAAQAAQGAKVQSPAESNQ